MRQGNPEDKIEYVQSLYFVNHLMGSDTRVQSFGLSLSLLPPLPFPPLFFLPFPLSLPYPFCPLFRSDFSRNVRNPKILSIFSAFSRNIIINLFPVRNTAIFRLCVLCLITSGCLIASQYKPPKRCVSPLHAPPVVR